MVNNTLTFTLSSSLRAVVLSAALSALGSCGGGGGGSPGGSQVSPPAVPTGALALNPANAQNVAAGATLTALGAAAFGTFFDSALVVQQTLPRTHVLARFLRQQLGRLSQAPTGSIVGGIVTTRVCQEGGFATTDGDLATAFTETFDACSEVPGQVVNGTIGVSGITLNPGSSFSGTASVNLTFTQTGAPDFKVSGSNISVSDVISGATETFTLSGPEIFTTTGTVSERLGSFNLVAVVDNGATETDTVTLNYASTKIGGSVDVTTVTPCVTDLTRQFPHSGVLSLTGAGGSKIRVTINGDEAFSASAQVKIELDADGNGTFESALDRNWADLAV